MMEEIFGCCGGLGCQRLVVVVCVCFFFVFLFIKGLVVLNLYVTGCLVKEILRKLKEKINKGKEFVKKRKLFFKVKVASFFFFFAI